MNGILKWILASSLLSSAGVAHAAPTNAELKIGITQEFENLNPLIMSMVATTYMHFMIGRSLVTLDADSKWVPQLAKEIPSLEKGTAKLVDLGGKKKVVAKWNIVDNAMWDDGHPLTCEDFAFAREIALSNTVSVGEKEVYSMVEKIDVDPKNPRNCTFTYDKARWDFYQMPQFYPMPKHIEGPVFAKYGKEKEGYEKNTNYVKNPTMKGLSCGPYVVSDVKLGDHVVFTPNAKFFGEKPKIQKIIIKLIGNTGTLEANLRSGTIDMISTLGLDFDQAVALEKKVKSENWPYTVQFVPTLSYEHIDVNLENPILKDLKVRQALLHGVNREDLVKALFDGKQEIAMHLMSPKDKAWFTADPKIITTYRYSKREAQKLLEEAGWKVGADGYRMKDGKKLSLVFMTTSGNKTRELVQTYLQEQWKQIGIEVLIKNQPAKVYFGETIRKRKFEGLALFAWVGSPENNPRAQVASAQIPTAKNAYSGQNTPGWKNAHVDEVVNKLDVEFDPKKRQELAYEIQKAYTADIPVLPLYYRADISVPPKNLKNYRMTGHQFYETNEIEKWTLE